MAGKLFQILTMLAILGYAVLNKLKLYLSLSTDRPRRRLSWFGHISRTEIDRLPCSESSIAMVTGEGRQAKKWMENIKEDFELRNLQFKDAV